MSSILCTNICGGVFNHSIATYAIHSGEKQNTVLNWTEQQKKNIKETEEDKDSIKQPAVFILEFEHVFPSYQWHRHSAVVKCALGMVRNIWFKCAIAGFYFLLRCGEHWNHFCSGEEERRKKTLFWIGYVSSFDDLHSVPIYRFSRIAPEYIIYKLLFMAQSNK